MAKIEVVIDGDQVPAVRDLFIEAGATDLAVGHDGAGPAEDPPHVLCGGPGLAWTADSRNGISYTWVAPHVRQNRR